MSICGTPIMFSLGEISDQFKSLGRGSHMMSMMQIGNQKSMFAAVVC